MKNIKICIMGMGYIGLPTAALLANRGYKVHGVDINQDIVNTINRGEVHIVEPDLDKFVKSAVRSGALVADSSPCEADVFLIAVPTPFYKDKVNEITKSPIPNIDYIKNALKDISSFIRRGNLILIESTSPVGTTNLMASLLKSEGVDIDNIYFAYSPERVLPGQIMKELIENDRVVGGINNQSTNKAASFYRAFIDGEVLETTARTAEMTKLTENSFRDVNIAFANELSMLCSDFDIDVRELITLANRHPRVDILNPGCGVGGHCISVDPWFLVDSSKGKAKMIKQARKSNNFKAKWVIQKIKKKAYEFEKKFYKKPLIACMGLAYKPNINDLRESPALEITTELSNIFNVVAVEPNVIKINNLKLVEIDQAIKSDIVVFLVNHKEFSDINVTNYLDFCGLKD
jgi:UDP-N-acetyl-D-mannosaminuronic acid dehydrogenase